MVQWLPTLINLQKIDLRIRDLKHRLTLLPGEMESLMKKRASLEAADAAAVNAVKKLEREIKQHENEIERLTAENQRLQQQSVMVKTNAEYTAMLNTVSENQRRIGDIEESLLIAMDNLDAEKSACAKALNSHAVETKGVKEEFAELLSFADEVKSEIAKLEAERKESGYGIDPAVFSRYTTLLNSKKGGIPLVTVENGICGSCHLRLTPQTLNELKKGVVGSCDSCQHLVYDPEAVEI